MLKDRLGKELLILDGGMGTLLQAKGLQPGELPETWNISHQEDMVELHQKFFEAGSDIVLANTFGANGLKFQDGPDSLENIITTGIANVKKAAALSGKDGREVYVGLDMGPTGKLLKPMGDLAFEDAYELYKEVVTIGVKAGADLIYIETMSDMYEAKVAVLAAKENCDLPVFVTMIFDEKGKLLTGGDVPAVVSMLEGLRVDALGINCGMGPDQMIPILEEIRTYTDLPIIVKPNAGLPKQTEEGVIYEVTPDEFAETMEMIVKKGAVVVGGCCGTTADHILAMRKRLESTEAFDNREEYSFAEKTIVSSYGQAVVFAEQPIIIGERINPTGKKKLKQALKEHDIEYILREAISQQDAGAHILDVNVGLPDIDEEAIMKEVVGEIQSVTDLPLQIDTVNGNAMEAAMRSYNGKPMVNSVNGKKESMDMVFPLIQKYGGVVVGLTLDEDGIPSTVEGRIAIARKIIDEAARYGIKKKDIVIDVLCMTISSEKDGAIITLEAMRRVREELGVHTVLGVSNISFGLPLRPIVNSAFYTMALMKGLSAGIINPMSEEMMRSYYSYRALMGLDENFTDYIGAYAGKTLATQVQSADKSEAVKKQDKQGENILSLKMAIQKGMREDAIKATLELLQEKPALTIIQEEMIPALDEVGKGFEKGITFLPQLLMSAGAAKQAFSVLKEDMERRGCCEEKKGTIILATVKGDIHDIGKNIVKVLLENYSFEVIDLGMDVDPEVIVAEAKARDIRLVGLSALMTTTVVSMEDTIKLLRKEKPDCKVMVGGAVLTQEYADMIGADFYGKDAMQSVYYAQQLFEK